MKKYTSFQAGPTFSYILFCAYFSLLFLENALISIILTVFTLNVIYAINFLHFFMISSVLGNFIAKRGVLSPVKTFNRTTVERKCAHGLKVNV